MTVYEFSYLGNYYYTKNNPPNLTGEGVRVVDVISNLCDRYPIDKRTIANHLEIKSTSLTVVREKKRKVTKQSISEPDLSRKEQGE